MHPFWVVHLLWWVAVVLFFCPSMIDSRLALDGGCDLAIVVPFTFEPDEPYIICSNSDTECYNAGYSHLLGAALAMEHFNSRNASVVPELADLLDCPLYLDWNRSRAFNEQTKNNHAVTQDLLQHAFDYEVPCAMVGPFHDIPALHLSTLGAGWAMPVLPHRAWSLNVASTFHSPYTTQVYPHMVNTANLYVQYMRDHLQRTNYIAVLHGLFDSGVHMSQALSVLMDELGIDRHVLFPYNSFLSSPANSPERQLDVVLGRVKDSGFRTIVCVTEGTYEELQAIAYQATRLGLVGEKYTWLFFGDFFYPVVREDADPVVQTFLAGALWVVGIENFLQDAGSDPFYTVGWASINDEFLNRVDHELAHEFSKYRQIQSEPEFGTGFMYDAVMATAFGTCRALGYHSGDYSTLDTRLQVEEIRRVNFTGASGHVSFGHGPNQTFVAREPQGVVHIVLNFFPPGTDELFRAPDLLFTDSSGKHLVVFDAAPPVFSNGRDMPNPTLRDLKKQYLSAWVRIFGFTLTGVSIFLALVCAVWVYVKREHQILRASQPHFLYQICAGSAILMSSMIPMTLDENAGWSIQQLDRACIAMPWLMIVGNILIYGALFSKLWRVNRVLQFARRTVNIKHVGWPIAILLGLALILLLVWTIVDPMQYTYLTVDEGRGEVLGTCESDHQGAFLVPLMIIMILPALMTEFMAWKTKDVDGAYSESYWIFIMILVQLEIVFFAIPVTIALKEVSLEGQYLGFAIITLVFATSPLGLIIFPKYIAYRKAVSGVEEVRMRGGGTGTVHVTGIHTSGSTATGVRRGPSDALDSNPSTSHHNGDDENTTNCVHNKSHPATSSMPTTVAELKKASPPVTNSMPTTVAELRAAAEKTTVAPISVEDTHRSAAPSG